jgi:SnoaL-like domain
MGTPLEAWHEIVRTRDGAALEGLLDDDVVFESPVVHTPQRGKAITTAYLRAALALLNNEKFRYLNEWLGPSSAVLEFATEVDGITLNGVDIISWNAAGKITHFKVMVRPLKAINTLHQKMGELLAAKTPA